MVKTTQTRPRKKRDKIRVSPEWCKVTIGAEYAGVSERLFRDWLKDGLKHSRLPSGTILIKYEWVDEYLESFAVRNDEVERIVDEVMRQLK